MERLDIQPIPTEPALLIKNMKALVVADLHIGIETELHELGLQVPSQTESMLGRLYALVHKYQPKEVILLGDIKHNIPSLTYQERIDVKHFLTSISSFGSVHILPGNHDGNLSRLIPESINLHPSDGAVIDHIGFVHGHRWPNDAIMQSEYVIIGHTHPKIMFTDRLGYKTFEPCWLRGTFLKNETNEKFPKSTAHTIIVMPAFNRICGGIAVNKESILGPFSRIIDVNNAEVYLLDGSSLGKVKHIQ
jgi:hypothetical protein